MKKIWGVLCLLLFVFAGAKAVPGPIEGPSGICYASSAYLSDSTAGGIWSCSDSSIVSIYPDGMGGCDIFGEGAGTVTITYTAGSSYVVHAITVGDYPDAILSYGTIFSPGTSYTFTDATSGCTWSSDPVYIAGIDSITGTATFTHIGLATIICTSPLGCSTYLDITVADTSAMPAPIAGTSAICEYHSGYLYDSVGGGIWSSSDSSIVYPSPSGFYGCDISASGLGSATVTYSIGSRHVTHTITVGGDPDTIISSATAFYAGAAYTFTDATTGCTWSSGDAAVAIIDSVTGNAAFTGPGYTTITCTSPGGCTTSLYISVADTSTIPGPIAGPSGACSGSTIYLSDIAGGGIWSSGDISIATVSPSGAYGCTLWGGGAGTVTITYTLGSSYVTTTITVVAPPAGIEAGATTFYSGAYCTFTDTTPGCTWTCAPAYLLYIDGTTGMARFTSTGTGTVTCTTPSGCSTSLAITVLDTIGAFGPIAGSSTICPGTPLHLRVRDSATAGVWSSSDPMVISVDAATGIATAVGTGPATITYTAGGSYLTHAMTVATAPGAITATATTICPGGTTTLSDATPGGTWYGSGVSGSGVVTGSGWYAGGIETYTYSTAPGCTATINITYTALIDSPHGPYAVCAGATATWTDPVAGGTWSSSDAAVATVSAAGVVTGIAAGTAYISYTVSGACGTATMWNDIIVNSSAPVLITGDSTVYVGTTTYLEDSAGTLSWWSSNAAIATVNAYGNVSGIATGTATIYCAATRCGVPDTVSKVITVLAPSTISGTIYFSSGILHSNVYVYLITYNPATMDLEAIRTLLVFVSGTSVPYQFTGVPADSFRIKAAPDSLISGYGYQPTYHTSSPHWSSAAVLNHMAGTADTGQNITMGYGVTTSGPGFISGSVTAGADRGTSGGVPVTGQLVFLSNSSGAVVQQAVTDASGVYSFSNLPVGDTYTVYPEEINYTTTTYSGIMLSTSSPSMSAADFGKHTVSKTIRPYTLGISNAVSAASISVFPNPATGMLNIKWTENATENAVVIVADITGREVYRTSITMQQGAGRQQIDLGNLIDGIYVVSIKTNNISYVSKVQVQK